MFGDKVTRDQVASMTVDEIEEHVGEIAPAMIDMAPWIALQLADDDRDTAERIHAYVHGLDLAF